MTNGILEKKQRQTALFAVAVSFFLAITKFIIAWLSLSLSVLASAVDSLMDCIASSLNYYSIKKSQTPADADHHYGHGKAESLAGFIQSELMLVSAGHLLYKAVLNLWHEKTVLEISYLTIGTMFVSSLISLILYLRMKKTVHLTDSLALKADSLHYLTDILSNAAVFIALGVIYFIEINWLDAVLSIFISLYIAYSTWEILHRSIDVLMDKSLSTVDLIAIHQSLEPFYPEIESYHNLQTRRSGNNKFIDIHLVMPQTHSLQTGHELAEKVIHSILKAIPNARINIHFDPKDDSMELTNQAGGIQSSLKPENIMR